MPWTRINSVSGSDTIPASVDARLTVLDVIMNRLLNDLDGPVDEATRIQLRSSVQILRGLARELRNDLGIT